MMRPRCHEAVGQGYANPARLADDRVAKEEPFREVQHIVGKVAGEAFRQGVVLEALSLAQLQPFSAAIEEDLYPIRAP